MVQSPNFKAGVGILATKRDDFQKHVDGTDFQHVAPSLLLSPTIIVNSTPTDTVQACLEAINALVPQVIPDAGFSSKGLIQLAGDLSGGTAASPVVTGIRGFPITAITPSNGDILTYDGGIPGWKPSGLATFALLVVSGTTTLNGTLNANAGYVLNGSTANISSSGIVTINGTGGNTLTSATGDVNVTTTSSGNINIKTLGGSGDISILSTNSNVSVNAGSVLSINGSLGLTITSGGLIDFNTGDVSISNNLNIGTSSSNNMIVVSTVFLNNGVTLGSSSSDLILIKGTIGNSTTDTVVQGALRFTNSTGRLQLAGIILNNANQTVNIRQSKFLVVPSTVSGTHTYTLDDTGTTNDDWFQFYNSSSFSQNLSGAIGGSVASGNQTWRVKIGGVWTQVAKP